MECYEREKSYTTFYNLDFLILLTDDGLGRHKVDVYRWGLITQESGEINQSIV